MEAYWLDWLSLFGRWLHLITGVAWIGASFYFVWLDDHLQPPLSPDDAKKGVGGELWAVHGGGFYQAQKYRVAPAVLPESLHWFKWEAYWTWISGFFLLCLIYYGGAEVYLIDTSVAKLGKPAAIGIGLATLAGGWIVYDRLCASPLGKNERALAAVLALLLAAAAFGLCHAFSGRGAFIHFGAMLGTIMVANVFFVIIPGQRELVAAKQQGRAPDPVHGLRGKQRSVHNTYFTLPVLLTMISNHYALVTNHPYNWAVLIALSVAGALIRIWFVARHKGRASPLPAAAGVLLLVILAVALLPPPPGGGATGADFAHVQAIVKQRCISCHAATPTQPGFAAAPKGVVFETPDQVLAQAAQIHQQTASKAMPIANLTQMTDEERAVIANWFDKRSAKIMAENAVHPVDEVLPAGKLIVLGLQHVLVMYAGAVAVPLILGGAMKLPKDQIALLINADLFACGIATIIQAAGIWKFGIRLPVMMGVTFASVGPMLAMGTNPELGLLGIYGAVIAAGIFGILVAPLVSRMLPLFPPVVTGTIITVIGISLMRVGINWAAGGPPSSPSHGDPFNLGVALLVLVTILLIAKYTRGFFANVSVLTGMVVGFVVSLAFGKVSFTGLSEAKWLDLVYPFQFGPPTFDALAIVTMCLVMVVVMIESTGMFLALGELTGRTVSQEDLTRGLRTDGVGTLIGGIFNTFPYTSFSQNVGLVGLTGVRSRWVCVVGGLILLAFGLFPKMAHVVASVPQFVLGGAGIVMFGMVAATGIRILSSVDYASQKANPYIIAISIGFGMIPLVADKFFQYMPKALGPLLHSGILLASIAAVVLNLYFNGARSLADARKDAAGAASHAEAG